MNMSKVSVTDFKIVWNNSGVNTACSICGDRTEPSINFQVQTSDGEDICETCLLEKATDLAEVLYAYFAYKHPDDHMTKEVLNEIKKQQLSQQTKPKIVNIDTLKVIQEATDAVLLSTSITENAHKETVKMYLVTKKWLIANDSVYAETFNTDKDSYLSTLYKTTASFSDRAKLNALYLKAFDEGAIIAEYNQ